MPWMADERGSTGAGLFVDVRAGGRILESRGGEDWEVVDGFGGRNRGAVMMYQWTGSRCAHRRSKQKPNK